MSVQIRRGHNELARKTAQRRRPAAPRRLAAADDTALSLLCILNVCILSYQLEYVADKVFKKGF